MQERAYDTFMDVTRKYYPTHTAGYVQRAHFEVSTFGSNEMANATFIEAMENVDEGDASIHNDYALFLRKHMGDVDLAESQFLIGFETNCA